MLAKALALLVSGTPVSHLEGGFFTKEGLGGNGTAPPGMPSDNTFFICPDCMHCTGCLGYPGPVEAVSSLLAPLA